MNYEQANSVKELAVPVNKVLEGLEIGKCPHCKEGLDPICRICNNTGKVKWKWQPKVGEWVVCYRHIYIITERQNILDKRFTLNSQEEVVLRELKEDFIPILPWETIEGILEKVGYGIEVKRLYNNSKQQWFGRAKISQNYYRYKENPISLDYIEAKSRQEAVMLAVIELGKEIKQ